MSPTVEDQQLCWACKKGHSVDLLHGYRPVLIDLMTTGIKPFNEAPWYMTHPFNGLFLLATRRP